MHRMVTVPSGSGMSHRMNMRKGEISGMFDVRVYAIDFFRLSKMRRPDWVKCERIEMILSFYYLPLRQ